VFSVYSSFYFLLLAITYKDKLLGLGIVERKKSSNETLFSLFSVSMDVSFLEFSVVELRFTTFLSLSHEG